jgi:hypothetical protein
MALSLIGLWHIVYIFIKALEVCGRTVKIISMFDIILTVLFDIILTVLFDIILTVLFDII